MLLSISYDIARIREKDDLLRVINSRLKSLFHFTHCGISIINQEQGTYTPFLFDPASKEALDPRLIPSYKHGFPIQNTIIAQVLQAEQPVVFDLDEIITLGTAPVYVKINQALGIKVMVSVALQNEKGCFGFFSLFSDVKEGFNKNQLNIIQAVSNQISIAVANILANEAILASEREKSMVLSFGKDITTCLNKNDFLDIVHQKMKTLFSYKELVISLLNEDGKTHSAYLYNLTEESKRHPDYSKKVSRKKYIIEDGVYDLVLKAERTDCARYGRVNAWAIRSSLYHLLL